MVIRAGPLAWAALRLFPLVGPLLIICAIVQYDRLIFSKFEPATAGCGPESNPIIAHRTSQDPWLFNTYQEA